MIAAYLALLAAAAVALAPYAAHAIGPYVAVALVAAAWWLSRRAGMRQYHRHGQPGIQHHRRPTRRHRARLALARARTVRLTIAGRTAC